MSASANQKKDFSGTRQELERSLTAELKSSDIDCIAFVGAPWVAMGVDAYLERLAEKLGRSLRAVIVITPTSDGTFTIGFDSFTESPKIEKILVRWNRKKATGAKALIQNALFAVRSIRYFILQQLPFSFRRPISVISYLTPPLVGVGTVSRLRPAKDPFILVDDGFLSYASHGLKQTTFAVAQSQNVFNDTSRPGLHRIKVIGRLIYDRIVAALCPTREELLYTLDSQGLLVDDQISQSYRAVIGYHASRRNLPDLPRNTILFATQPVLQKAGEAHLKLLFETMHRAADAADFKIFLKLHPRETAESYAGCLPGEVQILESDTPLEILLTHPHIAAVAGISSTALINAAAFLEKKSFSIAPWLLTVSNDEWLSGNCREFSALSSRYVTAFDELSEINFQKATQQP